MCCARLFREILQSYEFLAEIDFIRAKSYFAIQTNSLKPAIENEQLLDWTMAVHPLLQLSLATWEKGRTFGHRIKQETAYSHYLRSECRKISLSENGRAYCNICYNAAC